MVLLCKPLTVSALTLALTLLPSHSLHVILKGTLKLGSGG